MAQFTLQWDNTDVLANSNAIAQRALYRQRSIGDPFISAGFFPANDLAKSVNAALSPVLLNNIVYQFKVQSICTQNGPTDNDNGFQEGINFACITPVITKTETTSNITLNVAGLDITKARFTLRKASDNSIAFGVFTSNNVLDSISGDAIGLTSATNYYWQIELFANVNNVEVVSSHSDYLGQACSPYPFTTNAPVVCDPVISATVDSIEIL